MIFGNAAWGLRETPLEEQFKITAQMGLDALEIGIANAPMDIQLDIRDEEIDNIRDMSKKYGVKMLCGATGNDFTTGMEDIEKVKGVIDICKKLGIKNLRIFAGFTPLENVTDDMFDTMIKSLTEVCNYAKENGVVPVIETHGAVNGYDDGVEHIMSTTTNLETLKRIMDLLPDNARLCFDPSNLYAVGVENPEMFYEEFKGKIAYAHFKDFKKLPSGHLLPSYCGDSDMDWDKILKAMHDFDGAALFEYEITEDVKDGLNKCYKYIKERKIKKMNKPKVIFLPHANIQYSQLAPERRQWVMKNCYEKLFDLIDSGDYKIGFEASGITIDEMAKQAPEVLAKLKKLVQEGKVEPVCSPYIHFMLANIPKEVCLHSLKYSMEVWERHTGKRPEIGWNPECGWAGYIPDVYKEAGLKALIMDADSLMLSFDEIREATGLQFDVAGHSNKNHLFKIEEYIKDKPEFLKFITNASTAPNGLKMIFRSDCMANLLLWYLMGATEGMREEPINMSEIKNMLANWKERISETGSFIMPYAEDAEYIGSSAYFYVKQFNQARFFEEEPDSVKRFKEILDAAKDAGYELALPSEVLEKTIENEYVDNIENGVAWHGGTAKAWANTEYSRIMDPVCISILNGIKAVAEKLGEDLANLDTDLDNAMKALASAWVSDSRWPPAPTSPGRFNVRESLDDMYLANDCIAKAMENNGIAEKRGLYSPQLMQTQIKAIDDLLMSKEYFGE